MICNKVSAVNFRNIENETVEFTNGVNILTGKNAQGKTNLLEALYVISVGRSFRSIHESDIISYEKNECFVSLDFTDSQRKQNIPVRLFKDKHRQFEQNKVKIAKISDVIGKFRTVLFCPEHLSIIKDGPNMRRNYLDVAISQLRPVYLKSLQKYNSVLKQRNKLIKDAINDRKTFDETIDFWSEQLAEQAARIAKFRLWYIKLAEAEIKKCFSEMTLEREIPEIRYVISPKMDIGLIDDEMKAKEKYYELLSSSHEREIYAGSTLYGIHKDDIDITLNGKSARNYASQGQQRSLALSMKIAESEICRAESGEYPVLLLDDVLSELDAERRHYLMEEIRGKQVIMSTCEENVASSANIICVSNGKYTNL